MRCRVFTPPNECILCFEKPSAHCEAAKNYFATEKACYPNSESCPHSVSANAIQRDQERTLVYYQSQFVKVSPLK